MEGWRSCLAGCFGRGSEGGGRAESSQPSVAIKPATASAILSYSGSKNNCGAGWDISAERHAGARSRHNGDVVTQATQRYLQLFAQSKNDDGVGSLYDTDVRAAQDTGSDVHGSRESGVHLYGTGLASQHQPGSREGSPAPPHPNGNNATQQPMSRRSGSLVRRDGQPGPPTEQPSQPTAGACPEPSPNVAASKARKSSSLTHVLGSLASRATRSPAGTPRSASDRLQPSNLLPSPSRKSIARALTGLPSSHHLLGRSRVVTPSTSCGDLRADAASAASSVTSSAAQPHSGNVAVVVRTASGKHQAAAGAGGSGGLAGTPSSRRTRMYAESSSGNMGGLAASALAGGGPSSVALGGGGVAATAANVPVTSVATASQAQVEAGGVLSMSTVLSQYINPLYPRRSSIVFSRDDVTVTGLPPSCLSAGRAPRGRDSMAGLGAGSCGTSATGLSSGACLPPTGPCTGSRLARTSFEVSTVIPAAIVAASRSHDRVDRSGHSVDLRAGLHHSATTLGSFSGARGMAGSRAGLGKGAASNAGTSASAASAAAELTKRSQSMQMQRDRRYFTHQPLQYSQQMLLPILQNPHQEAQEQIQHQLEQLQQQQQHQVQAHEQEQREQRSQDLRHQQQQQQHAQGEPQPGQGMTQEQAMASANWSEAGARCDWAGSSLYTPSRFSDSSRLTHGRPGGCMVSGNSATLSNTVLPCMDGGRGGGGGGAGMFQRQGTSGAAASATAAVAGLGPAGGASGGGISAAQLPSQSARSAAFNSFLVTQDMSTSAAMPGPHANVSCSLFGTLPDAVRNVGPLSMGMGMCGMLPGGPSLLTTEARDVSSALSRLQEACIMAQKTDASQRLTNRMSLSVEASCGPSGQSRTLCYPMVGDGSWRNGGGGGGGGGVGGAASCSLGAGAGRIIGAVGVGGGISSVVDPRGMAAGAADGRASYTRTASAGASMGARMAAGVATGTAMPRPSLSRATMRDAPAHGMAGCLASVYSEPWCDADHPDHPDNADRQVGIVMDGSMLEGLHLSSANASHEPTNGASVGAYGGSVGFPGTSMGTSADVPTRASYASVGQASASGTRVSELGLLAVPLGGLGGRSGRQGCTNAGAFTSFGVEPVLGGQGDAEADGGSNPEEHQEDEALLNVLLRGDFLETQDSGLPASDDDDDGVVEYRYGGFELGGHDEGGNDYRRQHSFVEAVRRCGSGGVRLESPAACSPGSARHAQARSRAGARRSVTVTSALASGAGGAGAASSSLLALPADLLGRCA